MALTLGDNFSYQGAKPLDARLSYDTVAAMASKADSTLYDGILAFCKANGKTYQWKSTNEVDPTLGKWREFTSGGGGASALADLEDVEITDAADGDVLKYDAEEEKWVNGESVSVTGRAMSTAIAPEFDPTATYAEGDRAMYEDELYVFNTPHTGAWDAADVDKTDVNSEIPDAMSAADVQDVKDAFAGMNQGAPLRMMHYSTDEQVIGTWIDGKPLYQRTIALSDVPGNTYTSFNIDSIIGNNIGIVLKNGVLGIGDNMINSEFTFDETDKFSVLVQKYDGQWNIIIGTKSAYNTVYVTVRYTKTTD